MVYQSIKDIHILFPKIYRSHKIKPIPFSLETAVKPEAKYQIPNTSGKINYQYVFTK